ncbi:hypothetical protein [Chryseobacterium caseinilyticum]|uniref:Gliding motility-associated C-terminal domain-containing protein n=1 Tax=Chryseobacterium caseinilyticum TaxID=2771428 RepID=A0ABR8ZH08_9FLAO|nr:hypothetical protein [Chryseobacterium caseinilyticum]MBD8084547.1 hypothetical protein [Chryseobacterium caseinilyticum]
MNFHSQKLSAFSKARYCLFAFLTLLIQHLSGQARVFVNPGLEFGVATGTVEYLDTHFGSGSSFDAGSAVTAPWYTTQSQNTSCSQPPSGNCHAIEVWGSTFGNVNAAQGSNFVELNSFESSMIYQNVYLTPGDVLSYYYRHRARTLTTEQASMRIEDQNQNLISTISTTVTPSSRNFWSVNQGVSDPFTGAAGVYRVGFRAISDGGSGDLGNLLDDIRITVNPLIDLKFSIALPSCEGNSNGLLFLRINGAVAANTVVAVQLVNPQNGTAFISDGDITLNGVSNSQGTPTVSHTAGSQYYMVTIPPGNYDGGSVPGYSNPNNDEDGVAISIASVNDSVVEPDETFRFQIMPAGTNGSSSNFKSESSPIFGDTYYPSTNNYIIQECACYSPANTSAAGSDTRHGITTLNRAGSEGSNWPMVRKSGHTVLESNTKGFVINRLTSVQINNIVSPQEGMMVYDINAKCLKIYDGTAWSCFNTQTCP